MSDLIERQAAIDALDFEIVHMTAYCDGKNEGNPLVQYNKGLEDGKKAIEALPSAQPEQRYTEEELRVFAHGISLSLLSKRSAQHWRYDEDTATEIEFLERLYDKVSAHMKGIKAI